MNKEAYLPQPNRAFLLQYGEFECDECEKTNKLFKTVSDALNYLVSLDMGFTEQHSSFKDGRLYFTRESWRHEPGNWAWIIPLEIK